MQLADEAVCIGEGPSSESYLNIPNLLSAALSRGVQAIHPVSILGHMIWACPLTLEVVDCLECRTQRAHGSAASDCQQLSPGSVPACVHKACMCML